MNKEVYLDNAATTKLDDCVLNAMLPYFTETYGNPSSIHKSGRDAKKAINDARIRVAATLNAEPSEIYFTSCATESDNWALRGTAEKLASKGKHIITSAIEHHAILHTLKDLEKKGFEVTYLPVYDNGIIKIEDLKNAIREDTILISIMAANNEIGTIMPVEEIGRIAKENKIYFHTDAVQAFGSIPIDVKKMNIDMLSLSAHKFYGPKGIGVMYMRNGISLPPLLTGGAHERNKRAGTENVPLIVGLSVAAENACRDMEEKNRKIIALRDKLIDGILNKIPYSRLNGDRNSRLPGNCNISIMYVEGESMLLSLDVKGIRASSGSACTSGSLDPSHVLLAIGLPHEIAHGSLRFSIGKNNTEEDIDYVLDVLPGEIDKLRKMSPLWEEANRG